MSEQQEDDTSLLRELAAEANRLTVALANAVECARELRDRAASAGSLGLRDGDVQVLREFREDTLRYILAAVARHEDVEGLTKQLPREP